MHSNRSACLVCKGPGDRLGELSPAEILTAMRAVMRQCANLLAAYPRAIENVEAELSGPPQKVERQIEVCIVEASPGPDGPPISRRKLAVRAGYAYTAYFREAVTALIKRKVLAESSKGVWRVPNVATMEPEPTTTPNDRLVEECILAAAPGPNDVPITRAKLAPKAGYGYNDHYLHSVRKLLQEGKLVEIDRRIRRAA